MRVKSDKNCCICRKRWKIISQLETRETVRFHKFPYRNTKVLKKWIHAVRKSVPKFTPKGDVRICSLHFRSSDYKTGTGKNFTRYVDDKFLKDGVVPSLYLLSIDWPNVENSNSRITDCVDRKTMIEEHDRDELFDDNSELRESLSTKPNLKVHDDSGTPLFQSVSRFKKQTVEEHEESSHSSSDLQSETKELLQGEGENPNDLPPQSEHIHGDGRSIEEHELESEESLSNTSKESSSSSDHESVKIAEDRNMDERRSSSESQVSSENAVNGAIFHENYCNGKCEDENVKNPQRHSRKPNKWRLRFSPERSINDFIFGEIKKIVCHENDNYSSICTPSLDHSNEQTAGDRNSDAERDSRVTVRSAEKVDVDNDTTLISTPTENRNQCEKMKDHDPNSDSALAENMNQPERMEADDTTSSSILAESMNQPEGMETNDTTSVSTLDKSINHPNGIDSTTVAIAPAESVNRSEDTEVDNSINLVPILPEGQIAHEEDAMKEPAEGTDPPYFFSSDSLQGDTSQESDTAVETTDASNIQSDNGIDNEESEQQTYTCSICEKVQPTLKRYKRHKKWHIENRHFRCKICKNVLASQLSWEYHMNKHNNYKPYQCSSCDKSFFSKTLKNYHEKRHREVADERKIVADFQKENQPEFYKQGETPNILCSYCDDVFVYQKEYELHKKWHADNRSYTCKICRKILSRKNGFDYHMGTHEKERPFPCESCGKTYLTQALLNEHMKRHKYACNFCPKTFTAKFKLRKHRLKHKPKKYGCEICGKRFRKEINLRNHLTKHTSKTYPCEYCGNIYPSKQELDSHIKRSGENLTICVYCLDTFEDYLDFKRHIMEKHKKEESFVCTQCDKAFVTMKLLEDHIQTHADQAIAS